ncbi:MAG: ribosome biogenesis protein [Nitrososphaerales archaeon]|nr:ribosome biogenesis protein [Nitrososphaerales archaeon]
MKLNLVIAEAALELVPKELWRDPSVVNDARRREVEPGRILLDRSFHHRAMLKLKDGFKRGRPDLVHVTLLSTTGSPLYTDGLVKVFVHMHGDLVVELEEKTRIPKSYFRFRGLMEQALSEKPSTGLLRVYQAKFERLVGRIDSDSVVGLSRNGRTVTMEELCSMVLVARNPCLVVGGFAHGHFALGTTDALDELVRVHEKPLDAHVVASRVLYEVEKRIERTND